MLTFGAEQMFESDGVDLEDADLDALLDRSRQYDESNKKQLEGSSVLFCGILFLSSYIFSTAGSKLSSIRQNASDFNLESAKKFTTYLFQGQDMSVCLFC